MELIAALALLLQADRPDLDSVRKAIRYLARHQAEDGLWGRRPPSCTCPREPVPPVTAPDAPTRAKVAALILALNDDDPDRRSAAQKALVEIGRPAVPQLLEAEASGEVETRTRAGWALDAMQPLLTAPDLELTGLAVFLFTQAGYLSSWPREEDGIHMGRVVKKALEGLMARQEEDGGFGTKDPAAQAIAALVLNEDFHGTRRDELREAARNTAFHVMVHPTDDPRALLWQHWALATAEENQFAILKESRARIGPLLVRQWSDRPSSISATCRARLTRGVGLEGKLPSMNWILSIPPSRMDRESLYLTSLAAWHLDGPRGEQWSGWNTQVKAWLPPRQIRQGCDSGAWVGKGTADRMRAAIYGGLAQQFFFR